MLAVSDIGYRIMGARNGSCFVDFLAFCQEIV